MKFGQITYSIIFSSFYVLDSKKKKIYIYIYIYFFRAHDRLWRQYPRLPTWFFIHLKKILLKYNYLKNKYTNIIFFIISFIFALNSSFKKTNSFLILNLSFQNTNPFFILKLFILNPFFEKISSFTLNSLFEKQVHFYTEFICLKDKAYLKLKNIIILKLFFMLRFFSFTFILIGCTFYSLLYSYIKYYNFY